MGTGVSHRPKHREDGGGAKRRQPRLGRQLGEHLFLARSYCAGVAGVFLMQFLPFADTKALDPSLRLIRARRLSVAR